MEEREGKSLEKNSCSATVVEAVMGNDILGRQWEDSNVKNKNDRKAMVEAERSVKGTTALLRTLFLFNLFFRYKFQKLDSSRHTRAVYPIIVR